ncbi:dethiobiotin synthase [Aquimarina sp. W85]|uniref:dethiobiotin synthase n=1 Tax=Aquimarina rhodophyticola TaxID=3342246 RepID=UPI0036708BBE
MKIENNNTPKRIFITGIGTEVGKTITSAIVVEALQADYFKPIQAGDLAYGDADKVKTLVSNTKSVFHPNSYALRTPMSPHAAAEKEGITIDSKNIVFPNTKNALVAEGAGGILVPLNDTQTILDIIPKEYTVIVVSRHYLGSINHTLMTLKLLEEQGFEVALIFSGAAHPTTENIIEKMSKVNVLGRIDEEPYFDKRVIEEYAEQFKNKLEAL